MKIQHESDAFRWGESRDEHFFVRDLLWKAFRISVITDEQICLHYENGTPLLIDQQLMEPERSHPKNWAITQVDDLIPSLSHSIYLDGDIHVEGFANKKTMHRDTEVNRWYEQARETHSRIKTEYVLEAMKARPQVSAAKQLELVAMIMKGIMKARFDRFKFQLPTHYGDKRLTAS